MRFKTWFENLAGPGGGPAPRADSPEELGKTDAKLGVGAYPKYGNDNPPPTGRSPTTKYLDPRFPIRAMKKKMRK